MINLSSGDVDQDLDFVYEENTEVYNSCAASLNDEMFVIGGRNRQV